MKAKPEILLFGLVLLASCVDEYKFNHQAESTIPIIEGYIADIPNESIIWLSWTSSVNDYRDSSITGAKVFVTDNLGQKYTFLETSPGVYTLPNGEHGGVGRKYALEVKIGADVYLSDTVIMEPALPIDTINLEPRFEYVSVSEYEIPPKIAIYQNSFSDEDAGRYYTFDIEETYLAKAEGSITYEYPLETYSTETKKLNFAYVEYLIPFGDTKLLKKIHMVVHPDWIKDQWIPISGVQIYDSLATIINYLRFYESSYTFKDFRFSDTLKPEIYRDCWKTNKYRGYQIASTYELAVNQIFNQLVYIDDLHIGYKYENSLLIKERSLNSDAFHFIDLIRSFRAKGFELTQVQQGFVDGNIQHTANTEKKVLGCFYASSYHNKRFFVKNRYLSEEAKSYLRKLNFDCAYSDIKIVAFDTSNPESVLLRNTDVDEYNFLKDSYNHIRSEELLKLEQKINKRAWVIYEKMSFGGFKYGNIDQFYLMKRNCFDCRNFGTPVKPDFWYN